MALQQNKEGRDKHAIEVIYKEKGWSASRICQEFPSRGWNRTTVHDLLKKIDLTATIWTAAVAVSSDVERFNFSRSAPLQLGFDPAPLRSTPVTPLHPAPFHFPVADRGEQRTKR
ncbi:unnamed protein product [Cyprideis torosa]|uniref:Uncharacterized protein n=1 Tax=Cyprideis torosa TaxID=163714 RepID=A0A7R8WTB6_9CRUS|nr:unnamed protein product [Cyprideis torosa]CAG0904644.1 unnamed protein product [Cyprideis torosa]